MIYVASIRATAEGTTLVHWVELASAEGVTRWRVGAAVDLVSGRDLGAEIVRRHRAALRRRLAGLPSAGVQLEITPPAWAGGAGQPAQKGPQE